MKFIPSLLPEVIMIQPQIYVDLRGWFFESWNYSDFVEAGIDANFVQACNSASRHNVLRGLHYQLRHPQGKHIRVLNGEIYDVVVDIRQHSQTFGRWVSFELSEKAHNQLWVPPGFAHGFWVKSEEATVSYMVTDFWQPEDEHVIPWNDPTLAIQWPFTKPPILSAKDQHGTPFVDSEVFV